MSDRLRELNRRPRQCADRASERSVVQYGPEHFAQFTPAEAYELADIVIKAADFLRELEGIMREEPARGAHKFEHIYRETAESEEP